MLISVYVIHSKHNWWPSKSAAYKWGGKPPCEVFAELWWLLWPKTRRSLLPPTVPGHRCHNHKRSSEGEDN